MGTCSESGKKKVVRVRGKGRCAGERSAEGQQAEAHRFGRGAIHRDSQGLHWAFGYIANGRVNKSTFYHYFESKEALVLEALTLRSESEHKFREIWPPRKRIWELSSVVETVTRAARSGKFVGCPLAAFAYQLSEAEAKC